MITLLMRLTRIRVRFADKPRVRYLSRYGWAVLSVLTVLTAAIVIVQRSRTPDLRGRTFRTGFEDSRGHVEAYRWVCESCIAHNDPN
jgi:hypothetical protein